jgi:hypothetical protein
MTHYDKENDNTNIIDLVIKNELGTQKEIQLYEQLNIALELIDDDFNIIYSEINNGINFGITTPYPNSLPESVGTLFFNIDLNFYVEINEVNDVLDDELNINLPNLGIDLSHISDYFKPRERYYLIKITTI